MSLAKILRLRGSAVSLESHKSQRKLDQLQRDRRSDAPAPPAETPAPRPEPTRARIDNALQLVETTREAAASGGKYGGQTWTQAYQQRQREKRIAEKLKKQPARHAPALTDQPAPWPPAQPADLAA